MYAYEATIFLIPLRRIGQWAVHLGLLKVTAHAWMVWV